MIPAQSKWLFERYVSDVFSIEKIGAADGGNVGIDGVAGFRDAGGPGHAHHHASACGKELPVLGFCSHMEDPSFDIRAAVNLKAFLITARVTLGSKDNAHSDVVTPF